MPWTEKDREDLKSAIAMGVTEVRNGDNVTRYRSLDEMRQTLALIEADIGSGRTRRIRSFVVHGRRGW